MEHAWETGWASMLGEVTRHARCQVRRQQTCDVDPDDVAQEAVIRLLERRGEAGDPALAPDGARRWLRGAVRNVVFEQRREQRRRRLASAAYAAQSEPAACEMPWQPPLEDRAAVAAEARAWLAAEPDLDARLFVMLLDGESLAGIAQRAGCSRHAATSRLRHVGDRWTRHVHADAKGVPPGLEAPLDGQVADANPRWTAVLGLRDRGLSWRETADALGLTVEAARQLHRRATAARLFSRESAGTVQGSRGLET